MKKSIKVRDIQEMVMAIKRDPALKSAIVANPETALTKLFQIIPDTRVYRYVIIFLGLAVLLTIVGYFFLTINTTKELEPAIIALASGAVGVLAGIISKS